MAFCSNCGSELMEGAKFCQKCGRPVRESAQKVKEERQQEYAGKVYKCPNCGEVLKSFEINCPACGYELREAKVSNAVKEFAAKLEAIESRREYEKSPHGIFAASDAAQRVSKTDEQKISLIKSFSVPNTKEDMLEFMILATSSINIGIYDSTKANISKSEKEINAAWFAKAQQVYEKAKRTYSSDDVFIEIKALYDNCNTAIRRAKKKSVLKWIAMCTFIFGCLPAMFLWLAVDSHISERKEVARLNAIVAEIEAQLEKGEYKYALMNADTLVYSGTIRNEEQERQWIIKREYWVDKVIEEAAENGIILERPIDAEESEETTYDSGGGFVEGFKKGFKEGLQPGLDSAKGNIEEFNRTMDGEKAIDDPNKE